MSDPNEVDPLVVKEIEERARELAIVKAEHLQTLITLWKENIARLELEIKENQNKWCEHIYALNSLPLEFEISEYVDVKCLACAEVNKEVNVDYSGYLNAKNGLEHYIDLLKKKGITNETK